MFQALTIHFSGEIMSKRDEEDAAGSDELDEFDKSTGDDDPIEVTGDEGDEDEGGWSTYREGDDLWDSADDS